jgi:hypothetical protein
MPFMDDAVFPHDKFAQFLGALLALLSMVTEI